MSFFVKYIILRGCKGGNMDSSNMKNWLIESIEKSKEEIIKLSKIGKLRLEIANFKRKKNIKFKNLGKKVFTLIDEGSINKGQFDPDYTDLVNIFNKIDQIKKTIEELKVHQEIEIFKNEPEKNVGEENISTKINTDSYLLKEDVTREIINEKPEDK